MVKHLAYKKTKIPYRVSYYAIKHFQEETKKPIDDIDDDFSLLEVLLWYAIEAGYKAENGVNPFQREETEFILDSCLPEFIAEFGNFFQEGQMPPAPPAKRATRKK